MNSCKVFVVSALLLGACVAIDSSSVPESLTELEMQEVSGAQMNGKVCQTQPSAYCTCSWTSSTPGLFCSTDCVNHPSGIFPALECSATYGVMRCDPQPYSGCNEASISCGQKVIGNCVNGVFVRSDTSQSPCESLPGCSTS